MRAELSASAIETIKQAARKLTGFRRREFQAEVAAKFCDGSPRRAERAFGWGRDAVNTGLQELRSGIRCCDNFTARGCHKLEEQSPQLADEIHALVQPESQADPKFQTPFAYTRMTARQVREQLAAKTAGTDLPLPAERTLRSMLNRLGYRLRRVRKTKPQKNLPKPTPSSTICGKSIRKLTTTRKRSASRSTPRPK
jgi:hypothetical protein